MSRSYPIGSLLVLEHGSALRLGDEKIDIKISQDCRSESSNARINQSDQKYYILDGQQRITSIVGFFLDADKKRRYFFDLEKMLDPEAYDKHRTSWIDMVPNTHTKIVLDRESKRQYLSPGITLDHNESYRHVQKYIRSRNDLDEDNSIEAGGRITGIFGAIRNYQIPVIILKQDSGVESICRIFETINSTGTRLKTFDLAVARFYSEGVNLRKLWSSTIKKHEILKRFEVDGERILQVLYLVKAIHDQKDYFEPTRSNLLGLDPNQIKQEWSSVSEALAKTYKWAQEQGAQPKRYGTKSTLPSDSVLLSLAAVESLGGNILNDHAFIRRWYFSKTIQTGVSQSLNYQIGQNSLELWNYVKDRTRPKFPPVILNVDILLKPVSSDVRYKALQNILATTIRQDLISGKIIDPDHKLHNHHIFPKSLRKNHSHLGDKLDSICNRITILAESNQGLSNKPPETYFKEMVNDAHAEGTLSDLKRRMECCLIPGNPNDPKWLDGFSIDRFEEFCYKRAVLILSKVEDVLGNSLQINDVPSDEG